MENEELLQQIGLTQLEARAYLKLLKTTSSTAGEIAKRLNVQRSTAYYVLESLQKKGFVVFALKGKRKLFQASDPHVLERHAHETYEMIKGAVPQLAKQKPAEEKDEALLFTGYKGLRAAYEQMLAESKAGEEYLVLGARGGEDVSRRTYSNFYKNFNKRRAQKKVGMRAIINAELKKALGKYYEGFPRTKVRYIKQQTLAPIVVFPTAVAIVQWKEEPSLFLLKGTLVRDSFRQYFDMLWQVAKT